MTVTTRTREEALAEVRALAGRRDAAQAEADVCYQQLVELFAVLYRQYDPPLLQRELAEAAGMKMVTVNAAITKFRSTRATG